MVINDGRGSSVLTRRASALLETLTEALGQEGKLTAAAHEIAYRVKQGGTVYTIGNGGAAALAEHLTAELLGRLSADRERPPISAYCLCSNTAVMTAIAETSGFAECFAHQLRAAGRPEDVLVIFTTSGRSANLVTAMRAVESTGIYRLAFSGPPGSEMDSCEAVVYAPSSNPGTVQECHLLMLHALVESIEDALTDLAMLSEEAV